MILDLNKQEENFKLLDKNGKIKYSSIKLIGEGGQADVFSVLNVQTNDKLAVKRYSKQKLLKNQKLQKQIQQELTFMHIIKHQNIINLIDYLETKQYLYIFMDLCDGDLIDFMKKQPYKHLTEDQAKVILVQLVKGFSALHEQKIIHRDLKLPNILLKGDIVKIADLGFARKCPEETIEGTLCGTLLSMAPEILKKKKYGLKVDIWSLGFTYYQLLTGQIPFQANTITQYYEQAEQQNFNFVFNENRNIKISDISIDFIKKCLIYEQDKRLSWKGIYEHDILKGELNDDEIKRNIQMYENLYKEHQEQEKMSQQEQMDKNLQLKVDNFIQLQYESLDISNVIINIIEQKQENYIQPLQQEIINKINSRYVFEMQKLLQLNIAIVDGIQLTDSNFYKANCAESNLQKSQQEGEKIFLSGIALQFFAQINNLHLSLCQNNNQFSIQNFELYIQSQECIQMKETLKEIITNFNTFLTEMISDGIIHFSNQENLKKQVKLLKMVSNVAMKGHEDTQKLIQNFFKISIAKLIELSFEKLEIINFEKSFEKRLGNFIKNLITIYDLNKLDLLFEQYNNENFSFQKYIQKQNNIEQCKKIFNDEMKPFSLQIMNNLNQAQ